MSQPQEHILSDSDSNICEIDSEFSTENESKSNGLALGSATDDISTESDNETHPLPQKSVEECLVTIRNLETTCRELHNKYSQQQANLNTITKQYALAVKDKELMVMRYAVGEKTVLELRSTLEYAEKKQKDILHENEILQHKLNGMALEKSRICQMLDDKTYDLKWNQQEYEKVKLDLNNLETKLKWSQNSLKVEKELRTESDAKVENLRIKLQEFVNDVEHAKRDAQESIKAFHHSQENRAHVLELQVQEQQAAIILLRHERDDHDKQVKLLQAQLEKLASKEKGISDQNITTSARLQVLEKERIELKDSLEQLKNSDDELKQTKTELHEVKQKFHTKQKNMEEAIEKAELLKQHNSDLDLDLHACRQRESELLLFTRRLTDKNVQLQSQFTALETKIQQLTCEQTILNRNASDFESRVDTLTDQLVTERYKYAVENSDLEKKLQAQTRLCETLSQEVSDQQGENSIIKRKLELSLKEMHKELQQCRKKIDQFETASQSSNSSSTSLNAIDTPGTLGPSYADGDQVKVIQPVLTLDKQALVEHIVKLQRISARKSEKMDFLEEHINTLVAELQRKTHLLQGYIIREQTGTMTSNKMDKNKANLAKLNGIMASVYGSRVADSNLTLELSLDINRKLQAVLEDALLKNITLKENIDTLGAEIDRLNNLLKSTYTNTVNT